MAMTTCQYSRVLLSKTLQVTVPWCCHKQMMPYSVAQVASLSISWVFICFHFTLSLCTLWYLSSSYSLPPGIISPISFSPLFPSVLLTWSFYRISLRSSPLSLVCSIKDASLKHTHIKDGRRKIGKRRDVIEIRAETKKTTKTQGKTSLLLNYTK